ncbi:hypothetical protein OFO93_29100, partial [Escherichia coli]|nr:hypothetical protein [Escherichia coli]
DSLRSVVRLRRAVGAVISKDKAMKGDGREIKKAAALPVFHRLRPPDEHPRNQVISGAQIRSGETRQDLKIPTVSGR